MRPADPRARLRGDAWLDQPPRCEDLLGFLRRRVGDEGAAIALGAHQALEGEHLQRGAHDGPAGIEKRTDLVLRQLGARPQAAVDDRIADMVANEPRRDPSPVRRLDWCGMHFMEIYPRIVLLELALPGEVAWRMRSRKRLHTISAAIANNRLIFVQCTISPKRQAAAPVQRIRRRFNRLEQARRNWHG